MDLDKYSKIVDEKTSYVVINVEEDLNLQEPEEFKIVHANVCLYIHILNYMKTPLTGPEIAHHLAMNQIDLETVLGARSVVKRRSFGSENEDGESLISSEYQKVLIINQFSVERLEVESEGVLSMIQKETMVVKVKVRLESADGTKFDTFVHVYEGTPILLIILYIYDSFSKRDRNPEDVKLKRMDREGGVQANSEAKLDESGAWGVLEDQNRNGMREVPEFGEDIEHEENGNENGERFEEENQPFEETEEDVYAAVSEFVSNIFMGRSRISLEETITTLVDSKTGEIRVVTNKTSEHLALFEQVFEIRVYRSMSSIVSSESEAIKDQEHVVYKLEGKRSTSIQFDLHLRTRGDHYRLAGLYCGEWAYGVVWEGDGEEQECRIYRHDRFDVKRWGKVKDQAYYINEDSCLLCMYSRVK